METQLKEIIKDTQPQLKRQFEKVIEQNKLTHAYLFDSQDIELSYHFALWVAQSIFCLHPKEKIACGTCENCRRVEILEFPDITVVEPDGQFIKVDQIRQVKQTFVRSGMESRKKVLIIKEVEKMTSNAANGLLKFIEEPDGLVTIFFLSRNAGKILPTIQSRCQIVHLKPVSKKKMMKVLKENATLSDTTIHILAELSDSLDKAVELSNDEWFNSARDSVLKWYDYLEKDNSMSFIYVQQTLMKLAKDKEQQLRFLDMLLILYRIKLSKTSKGLLVEQKKAANSIKLITKARQKMEANVSFQNASEQLVWQILNRY